MEPQVDKNAHFRHILLFEYNRNVKASEAAQTIRNVYKEESIGDSTDRKWFSQFKDRNFKFIDVN